MVRKMADRFLRINPLSLMHLPYLPRSNYRPDFDSSPLYIFGL